MSPLDGSQDPKNPDFNVMAVRMLCSKRNLQVLCKPCHKKKTAIENDIRLKNWTRRRKAEK